MKEFAFATINDGSCFKDLQIVLSNADLSNYDEATHAGNGSAIYAKGKLKLTPDAPQPFELAADEFVIEGPSGEDYPLQKKRATPEFLRTIQHLRPRTNMFRAIFRIRSVAAYAIHQFFQDRGFVYVHTPIITASDCEGAGEMFKVDAPGKKDFFGADAALTVSGQLQAENFAMAFGDVYTFGRRGVAGTVFVHKIAGAKAETGASLEEVKAVAEKVIANVRTMGMAINPSTVPAAGVPGFELSDTEMEIGIGIHGEPGVKKTELEPTDAIVDQLLDKILTDEHKGADVAVMVNGCGGTPLMELFIVNNHVSDVLAEKGINVYKTFVGNYMTSLECEGFSISVLKLDDELKALLDAPADTPAFTVC